MAHPEIIITGATGFLGSHLLHACDPNLVIGTFHKNRPDDDGYAYIPLDLENLDSFAAEVNAFRPRVLVHAAAQSNLDWCENNPELAWQVNADAPVRLAEICANLGCRYLFVSSDMVFDGEAGYYGEGDMAKPISLYGRAKHAAEVGVLAVNPDALVARVALIYGIPVAVGRGSSFLNWLLSRLDAGETVPVFIDQFRTPVFVGELARTLLTLAEIKFAGIVHVGGPERLDRYTFAQYVCRFFDYDQRLLRKTRLAEISSAALRPRDLSLRTELLTRLVGGSLSTCESALEKLASAIQ